MTDVSTTCAEAIFRVKTLQSQESESESRLLTLKKASAQVVETSVTNNSPSQDSNHPDDLFQSRHQSTKLQFAIWSDIFIIIMIMIMITMMRMMMNIIIIIDS